MFRQTPDRAEIGDTIDDSDDVKSYVLLAPEGFTFDEAIVDEEDGVTVYFTKG